jgi:hypothetical protein
LNELPELLQRLPKEVQGVFVSAYAFAFEHGVSAGECINIAWDAVFSVYVPGKTGYHLKPGWNSS